MGSYNIIEETNVENLFVIQAGSVSPNPTALLQSENFATMIDTLRKYFDYIVVDTAPIGVVIDAAIITQKCDASVLVTAAGETNRRDVQKAKEQLEQTGKPFFNHWMTVSNHRPFTYPDGKIDIPPTLKKRIGGVKYTDYALKHFFELAKQQEWYKNTLFVIVADHCASSAGSTELPLDGYRIPCFIYADFITPKKVDNLVSQIDVMPTVLGLLNFEYTSKFIGQDVFSGHYTPRAYIATYQDLGYLSPTHLTIVSPLNKIRQYQLLPEAEQPAKDYPLFYEQQAQTPTGQEVQECISAYQATSHWLKKQQLNAVKK